MVSREVGSRAISYDLDDVVIDRGVLSRVAGLVVWKVNPHQIIVPDLSKVPAIPREIVDAPLKGWR